MLFKLSNLNSNFALTLGYLNPALNNSALVAKFYVCWLFLVEELVSRGSRPARPGSVPVLEARDRLDTGPQSNSPTNPAKGMKSIKGKLMARPRTRSRVDYDELAQVQ